MKPRVGFLGLGWIGRARLQSALKDGRVEVAGLADPDASCRREAGRLAPGAPQFATLEELLREDLDGLVIATPSAGHAGQSARALQAGLPVFCQKPLGRTQAEVRLVVEAARAAGRLLAVDLSYRYLRGMRAIRALLAEGALGQVYAANLVFHNAYGPDKAWFYDPEQSGGGCLLDLGIHLIDLVLWSLDFPAVSGITGRLAAGGRPLRRPGGRVEDYAAALLDLQSGAAVSLACSWRLAAGQDAVIEASFYGTRGGAGLRNVNGSFYDFAAWRFDGTTRRLLAEPPDDWGSGAVADWIGGLVRGGAYDPQVERLIEVAGVIDTLYGRG